jgi:hypothetical protein
MRGIQVILNRKLMGYNLRMFQTAILPKIRRRENLFFPTHTVMTKGTTMNGFFQYDLQRERGRSSGISVIIGNRRASIPFS